MKLILIILISCTSCSLKNTQSSNTLHIDEYLNQPFSKLQQKFPNLEMQANSTISDKTYSTWSLVENDDPKIQVLTNPTTHIVFEILQFSTKTTSINKNDFPDNYKPKCEFESTIIKYDTKSNRIALEKNETIIFQGRSLLIQERIYDDKNKKCLNRWHH